MNYLITFRCYGTWVHGDERGSVEMHRGEIGPVWRGENRALENTMLNRLKHKPILLDRPMRMVTRKAICEVATHNDWTIHSVGVRTNQVHVVISGEARPDAMRNAMKARATRLLRESDLISPTTEPWSRGGSKLYLWNDEEIAAACRYVVEGQGDELDPIDDD